MRILPEHRSGEAEREHGGPQATLPGEGSTPCKEPNLWVLVCSSFSAVKPTELTVGQGASPDWTPQVNSAMVLEYSLILSLDLVVYLHCGRLPAKQAWGPEFKPQYHQKKKRKKVRKKKVSSTRSLKKLKENKKISIEIWILKVPSPALQ
jgi:hypothetical protein